MDTGLWYYAMALPFTFAAAEGEGTRNGVLFLKEQEQKNFWASVGAGGIGVAAAGRSFVCRRLSARRQTAPLGATKKKGV